MNTFFKGLTVLIVLGWCAMGVVPVIFLLIEAAINRRKSILGCMFGLDYE